MEVVLRTSRQIIDLLKKNNIYAESLVVDIHNSTKGENFFQIC